MLDKTRQGMIWIMLATTASKVTAIGAQIVLGYCISAVNFGNYAIALGMTTFFSWMKNGAVTQIAIQEAAKGRSLASLTSYARMFNIASSAGLLCLAWQQWSEENHISLLLLSFALSQALGSNQLRIQCHYSSVGQFKALGYFELGQSISRHAIVVIAALIFKDERCFAAAIIAVACYDLTASYYILRKSKAPSNNRSDKRTFHQTWFNARWLLLAALGSTIIMNGIFLAIGMWTPASTVGLYFFAFQLVSAISIIIGEATRKVLMPALSSISDANTRFTSFDRGLKRCIIIIVPASFGLAMAMAPLINLIWAEKWANATLTAQLLSISLFAPTLVLICHSYLEASEQWRLRSKLQVSNGATLLLTASFAAMTGDITWISLLVAIHRIFFGLGEIIISYHAHTGHLKNTLRLLSTSLAVSTFITWLSITIMHHTEASDLKKIIFSAASATISYLILNALKSSKKPTINLSSPSKIKINEKGNSSRRRNNDNM